MGAVQSATAARGFGEFSGRFQGKFADAAKLAAQTLEIRQRVLGAEHPNTLTTMRILGSACFELGKRAEAVALYVRLLEIRRRVLGAEHIDTFNSMSDLADASEREDGDAKAEPMWREILTA